MADYDLPLSEIEKIYDSLSEVDKHLCGLIGFISARRYSFEMARMISRLKSSALAAVDHKNN